MLLRKKIITTLTFLALAFSIVVPSAIAKDKKKKKGKEFNAVCNHLKKNYQAKKVKIPFMWLARFAVGIVKPAGVKSFRVTIFKDLQFSPETLNEEMKFVMQDAFSEDWTPLLRVRSAKGEQVFMNMREVGKNIKILLVTINKNEAVVVRAKFNPDKLVQFMDNPKIFGISLGEVETSSDDKIKIESDGDRDNVIYEDEDEEEAEEVEKVDGKLEEIDS